jgi:hypothetical protein
MLVVRAVARRSSMTRYYGDSRPDTREKWQCREVAVRAGRGEAERGTYADRIPILPIRAFRRSSRAFM